MTEAHLIDCMEYMADVPDKYFDLAVVDPPYGNTVPGFDKGKRFGGWFDRYKKIKRTGGGHGKKYGHKIIDWDIAPPKEYFDELFRVSKNQIIWGGNYFDLPPTRCFIVWDKMRSEDLTFSMCEYAWASFNENARIARILYNGGAGSEKDRFHPTQKPVALYEWIFKRYAKPGYKILDTHLGSGSSRIAAHNMNLDFVGCEIDEEYFRRQEQRFKDHISQITIDLQKEESAEQEAFDL